MLRKEFMKTDRYLIALALAASTVSATAGTVCVQDKQTGKYQPKNPTAGNALACADMNPDVGESPAMRVRPVPAPVAAAVMPAVLREDADMARQARTYRLKFSDVTVRLALKRWLKESNMQLAYEAQKDFPVPVEGDYTGPVSDVMLKLMTSLSESSYPLRACEYDNRVVLVVHRDEKCPLEDRP